MRVKYSHGDHTASVVSVMAKVSVACEARESICSSVRVLKGCSMTTGVSHEAPKASHWTSASCWKASVMMTAAGIPRCSSSIASCKLHDVHDPQSPIAVMTTSTSLEIWSNRSLSAGLEKLVFE